MKKVSTILTIIGSVLLLSACTGDPEIATQKDMINQGEFFLDYNVNGDTDPSHDFKLTMKKDYTYSLYIKDYDHSYNGMEMITVTGNWSHVLTYEYEYDTNVSHVGFFSKTIKATLGIYLLEGYVTKDSEGRGQLIHYFGYEKSSGKGTLFSAYETQIIDEKFLESYRESSHAHVSDNLGPVELTGLEFESQKNK